MKKTFTKVMLVLLTLILLVATATMAVYAVDWDGTSSSSGGSGGIPATGGYSVHPSQSLTTMCMGWRFSLAKHESGGWTLVKGKGMDGESCIEVWTTDSNSLSSSNYMSSSVWSMYPLTTKLEYTNAWKGKGPNQAPVLQNLNRFNRASSNISGVVNRSGMVPEGDIRSPRTVRGLNAPATQALTSNPSAIADWCRVSNNVERIAIELGLNSSAALNKNYCIIVEPVYVVDFAGYTIATTPSQFAQLGGSIYTPTMICPSTGVTYNSMAYCSPYPLNTWSNNHWQTSYDYNGSTFYYNGSFLSTQNTYAFIRHYLNTHFPISLYTTSASRIQQLWPDPVMNLVPNDEDHRDYNLRTCRDIMEEGYGVGLAWSATEPPEQTYYQQNIYYQLQNADGSYGAAVLAYSDNLPIGATCPGYTYPDSASHHQTEQAAYTVTKAENITLKVRRKSYPQTNNFYKWDPYDQAWYHYTSKTTDMLYEAYFTCSTTGVTTPNGFYWGGFNSAGWTVTGAKNDGDGNGHYYPEQHTVNYDANGGTGAPASHNFYLNGIGLNGTAYYSSTKPTRTGYTFTGWVCKENGVAVSPGQAIPDHWGSQTLVAQWSANAYYFDLNGYLDGVSNGAISDFGTCDIYINGSRVANDVTDYYAEHNYGTTYEIKDIKSTTGHTYNGVYSGSISGTITGTTSTTLNFTTNMVRLAYHPNGGTVSASGYGYNEYGWVTQNGVTYFHSFKYGGGGDPYDAATFGLTNPGYTFGGWRVDSTGKVLDQSKTYGSTEYAQAGDSSKTTANTSSVYCYLYAVWNPVSYTLTVNPNGGSWGGTTGNSTFTLNNGATKTIANPTRTGYTFTGWTVSNNACSLSGTTYTQGVGNCTLTANWKINSYTLKVDPNGGTWSGSTSSQNFTLDYRATKTIANPTRTGYTFKGWTVSNSDCSLSGTTYTQNVGDCTLTANWQVNAYTDYIYHWLTSFTQGEGNNGGAGDCLRLNITSFSTNYGNDFTIATSDAVTVPNGFSLSSEFGTSEVSGNYERYNFGYGFTQKAGSMYFDLYYAPNTYTITYDLNDDGDGIGPAANHASNPTSYNVLYEKTFYNPTRVGYDFLGWYIGGTKVTGINVGISNSGFASMTANQVYAELNSRTTGNKTAVAQWRARTDTDYIVRHYRMNTDGSTYTLYTTEYLEGTSDATLTLANLAKSYTGYKYSFGRTNGATVTSTTILPDGTRVIELYYDMQFDVQLTEIVIKDANGNVVTNLDRVPLGYDYTVWHTYKNDSVHALTFNGYHNGSKVTFPNGSQTVSIPANSSTTVKVAEFYADEEGDFSITGAVYRDGMTASTEKFETNLSNNTKNLNYEVVALLPWIEPIDPNQAYRENTDVITSFWLHNDTEEVFDPAKGLKVRIRIYDNNSNALLMTMEQDAIVPAGEDQLVYFKWHVPTLNALTSNGLTIKADLTHSLLPYYKNEVTKNDYDYIFWQVHQTPDTQFEETQPEYWVKPGIPSALSDSASWYVWEYSNNQFTKVTYGIRVAAGTTELTPDSKTAYKQDGQWYMKSGYGFFVNGVGSTVSKFGSYMMPNEDAYTGSQYNYLMFPEFMYGDGADQIATLERVGDTWQLYEFESYGRKHFTPLWYPDGTYAVKTVQTDAWTPMGALTVYANASTIIIDGNMYDDWYIN